MGRYIDADALRQEVERIFVKHFAKSKEKFVQDTFKAIFKRIDSAPTIEARPLVRGEWEMDAKYNCHCSNCHEGRNIGTQIGWNFCPYCGAKMDLE